MGKASDCEAQEVRTPVNRIDKPPSSRADAEVVDGVDVPRVPPELASQASASGVRLEFHNTKRLGQWTALAVRRDIDRGDDLVLAAWSDADPGIALSCALGGAQMLLAAVRVLHRDRFGGAP